MAEASRDAAVSAYRVKMEGTYSVLLQREKKCAGKGGRRRVESQFSDATVAVAAAAAAAAALC
jgi:hypothetical protein